uniref:Putative ovule protein n=1 Tax=Solanum chacoense TaxID=4108 RepID=A0A0V0GVM1_SOLCH
MIAHLVIWKCFSLPVFSFSGACLLDNISEKNQCLLFFNKLCKDCDISVAYLSFLFYLCFLRLQGEQPICVLHSIYDVIMLNVSHELKVLQKVLDSL